MDYGYAPLTRKDWNIFGCVCALILIVFFVCLFNGAFTKNTSGEETTIKWEYVRLREEPNTDSPILAKIYNGDVVTLTGNYYRYSDGPHSEWVEIKTEDGVGGWIVTEAISAVR